MDLIFSIVYNQDYETIKTLSHEQLNYGLEYCVSWGKCKLSRAFGEPWAVMNHWFLYIDSVKIARLGLELGYIPTMEEINSASGDAFPILLQCCLYYPQEIPLCVGKGVVPTKRHFRAASSNPDILSLFGCKFDDCLRNSKFAARYLQDKADNIDIIYHVIEVGNISKCRSLYSDYFDNYDVISRLVNAGCPINWRQFELLCEEAYVDVVNIIIPIISNLETFIFGYKSAVKYGNKEIADLLKNPDSE